MALASVVSKDLYKSVRADRAKDVKDGRARVRTAKTATFDFVQAWRVLSPMEQFGGQAAADHRRKARGLPALAGHQSGDEGGQAPTGAHRTPPKTPALDISAALQPFKPAPEGVKSAKARRAAQLRAERDPQNEARVSDAALTDSAEAAKARSGLSLFLHPQLKSSKATKRFKRMQPMYHLGKECTELDTSSDDEGGPSRAALGGSAGKRALSAGTAAGASVPSDDAEPRRKRTRTDLEAFCGEEPSAGSRPASPIPELRIIVADEDEDPRESVTPEEVRVSIAKAWRPNKTPSSTPATSTLSKTRHDAQPSLHGLPFSLPYVLRFKVYVFLGPGLSYSDRPCFCA